MNVKDFEYLIELGKAGSISKASQALFISQPALSKFLKKIEAEAGTPLFQHIGKALVPTYAGEQCIQIAEEIVFLHKNLMQNLSDIAHQQRGHIKLGLPMSRSPHFISEILPAFYQKFPGICVTILEDNTHTLIQKLRSGELNLVIANITKQHSYLCYQIVAEEEMVLAVPNSFGLQKNSFLLKDYRYPCLPLESWISLPFLMPSKDQLSRKFIDAFMEEHQATPNTIFKIRNVGQLLYSVQNNLGITICPSLPLSNAEQREQIRYFSLPSKNGPTLRQTAIIYREDTYLSIAEQELILQISNAYHSCS